MLRSKKCDLEWQALRYAVDQIDIAWMWNEDKTEATRIEMEAHRAVIVELQETALRKKHAYEEIGK